MPCGGWLIHIDGAQVSTYASVHVSVYLAYATIPAVESGCFRLISLDHTEIEESSITQNRK